MDRPDLNRQMIGVPGALKRVDVLLIAAGIVLTFAVSFVLGRGRIFWEDEMLAWMLLRDPSWHHMVYAWKMGADGGGFTFYITGRLWLHVFGPSVLAFRFYSAACFGLAFCVSWVTARRFYPVGIVAFAMFNSWFFNQWIVAHMAEGRFYGLLLLATAVAVLMAVRANDQPGASLALRLLTFLAHALLTTSHVLGVMYSGTILLAIILLDRFNVRWRPYLYLSTAAAWLLLIPERTAMISTARVGVPHFWTPPPNLSRFVGCYTGFGMEIAIVECFLIASAAIVLYRSHKGGLERAFVARRPVYILTLTLALIPVLVSAFALVGPSLLFNRYMMPLSILSVFLTAEPLMLLGNLVRIPAKATVRLAAPLLYCGFLLTWVFVHLRSIAISPLDYTSVLTARLPHGVPVLVEDAFMFTEVMTAQHGSGVQYTYLLDWPYSVSKPAPRLEVTQYHLMENWKKVGYFSGSIAYRDEFLRNASRFLIVRDIFDMYPDGQHLIGDPLFQRFSSDPAYEVLPYGSKGSAGAQDLWLVRRRDSF